MTILAADHHPIWQRLTGVFDLPESAASVEDGDFEALVSDATLHGVLPLLTARLQEAGVLRKLAPERRDELLAQTTRSKAACALWLTTLESVLRRTDRANLWPILLKGCHTALAYYDKPYLRPMSDLDLLFGSLGDAERSWALLKNDGFTVVGRSPGGSPWDWQQHLLPLRDPSTGCIVEIHGSLIFPPMDRRARKTAALWREATEVEICGASRRVLGPEANVIYTLVHLLEVHRTDTQKLIQLHDAALILKRERAALDWKKLESLAVESGFPETAGIGLALARELFRAPIDGDVADRLVAQGEGTGGDPLSSQNRLTLTELRRIAHAGGPWIAMRRTFRIVFPTRAYMRFRYPMPAGGSLTGLYGRRWANQVIRVITLLRNPRSGSHQPSPNRRKKPHDRANGQGGPIG